MTTLVTSYAVEMPGYRDVCLRWLAEIVGKWGSRRYVVAWFKPFRADPPPHPRPMKLLAETP